jgi:hypothetical protein
MGHVGGECVGGGCMGEGCRGIVAQKTVSMFDHYLVLC